MKFKFNQLFTVLAGLTLFVSTSYAKATDTTCRTTQVEFKKGITSTSYQGKIKGWQCTSYKFTAKKGQILTVDLATKGKAEAVLYDHPDFVQNSPYVLPKTASYELRVLHPKASAIKQNISSYRVRIKLSGQ